jgi:hypothetical protein
MLKRTLFAAAISLASLTATVPASAQAGLIVVTIDDVSVLNNFLNQSQIQLLTAQIPVTVQAPIAVAANVCNTTIALLSVAQGGSGECTAEAGSAALARLVNKQILTQLD